MESSIADRTQNKKRQVGVEMGAFNILKHRHLKSPLYFVLEPDGNGYLARVAPLRI